MTIMDKTVYYSCEICTNNAILNLSKYLPEVIKKEISNFPILIGMYLLCSHDSK